MTDDTRTCGIAGHFPGLDPTPAPRGLSGTVRTIAITGTGLRMIDTRGLSDAFPPDWAHKRAGRKRHERQT